MLSKHSYKDDETGGDVNMLDEKCITRNTRSLFYNFILKRLQYFVNNYEDLGYELDEEKDEITIYIISDIEVICEVKDATLLSNYDYIKELCKFIVGNICVNLFNYLIEHCWMKDKKLIKRINEIKSELESFLIIDNDKIDKVSLLNKNLDSSINEFIFEIISLSSFNYVSLELIENIFSIKFSSPIIKTLFKGIKSSIKKLSLGSLSLLNISDTQYLMIISEYKNDALTHMLYKFLVKSSLIYSIEEIELSISAKFDCNILFKLISEYKSKYNPKSTFILTYSVDIPCLDYYNQISNLWIDQIEKHPALNYKEIDTVDIKTKLDKYFETDDEFLNFIEQEESKESIESKEKEKEESEEFEDMKNKIFYEFKENCFPLMSSNKLLMYSLFYKWMRLEFFVYLLEAELNKPNGETTKCSLEPISCKITNDGHSANCKLKENGLEFTLIEREEEYEVMQTESLQGKLTELGFNCIKVNMPDKLIEELLVEYLEFVVFPLYLQKINSQNRKMIDKV